MFLNFSFLYVIVPAQLETGRPSNNICNDHLKSPFAAIVIKYWGIYFLMSFPLSTSHPTPHLGVVLSDGGAPSCSRLLVSSLIMRGGWCTQQIYEQPNPGSHFGNLFLGSLLVPFIVSVRMLAGNRWHIQKKKKDLARKISIKGIFKRWESGLRNQHGMVRHSGFSNSEKPLSHQGLRARGRNIISGFLEINPWRGASQNNL